MLFSTFPRKVLFACLYFPSWNLPSFIVECTLCSSYSRFDPPFSPQGATLAHLDSLSSRSGDLDRWLYSFSIWQGRLWRPCQLLILWHWNHPCLFGRPSMLTFFRWNLCHSASCSLVPAASTSLPLLTSSPPLQFSLCPCHPVLFCIFPFYLKLSRRSGRNYSLLSGYNGSPDTLFSRETMRIISFVIWQGLTDIRNGLGPSVYSFANPAGCVVQIRCWQWWSWASTLFSNPKQSDPLFLEVPNVWDMLK